MNVKVDVSAGPGGVHGAELGIVTGLFVLVAVLGFLAARWRRTG